SRARKRAGEIIADPSHPGHNLFQLLPSGRRYRSLYTKTTRHRNSFFPLAVTLMTNYYILLLYIIFIYFILNCCVILHIFSLSTLRATKPRTNSLYVKMYLANKHDSDSDDSQKIL